MLLVLGLLLYECIEWSSPAICIIDVFLFGLDVYFALVLLSYFFNRGSLSVSTTSFV